MSDGTSRRDFLTMARAAALGLPATEGLAQGAPTELHIGTAVYNDVGNRARDPRRLTAIVSECAWDAVLCSFTGRT